MPTAAIFRYPSSPFPQKTSFFVNFSPCPSCLVFFVLNPTSTSRNRISFNANVLEL
ncbi:hypothetical protein KsCSTR_34330 [Candidatus Kuenenia stuttgartiensis]|uniref:Uncharacterized protein n=1 Tax=Kuenenia stuttgartiensis TaxID=174633 RepID=Q1Q475_KUEST|nr:hypothetical protein KsCSTR_34330 [Candidatus Kuenenia stuttgartiensis]CAJ74809.1 unknown protein [Candidatus Kuenenia stuttgartiensis]